MSPVHNAPVRAYSALALGCHPSLAGTRTPAPTEAVRLAAACWLQFMRHVLGPQSFQHVFNFQETQCRHAPGPASSFLFERRRLPTTPRHACKRFKARLSITRALTSVFARKNEHSSGPQMPLLEPCTAADLPRFRTTLGRRAIIHGGRRFGHPRETDRLPAPRRARGEPAAPGILNGEQSFGRVGARSIPPLPRLAHLSFAPSSAPPHPLACPACSRAPHSRCPAAAEARPRLGAPLCLAAVPRDRPPSRVRAPAR
jgi:hypothetical protein